MPLHYLMIKLDAIRLTITGPFQECAEDIVDRYDTKPTISESDIEFAESIVKLAEAGKV